MVGVLHPDPEVIGRERERLGYPKWHSYSQVTSWTYGGHSHSNCHTTAIIVSALLVFHNWIRFQQWTLGGYTQNTSKQQKLGLWLCNLPLCKFWLFRVFRNTAPTAFFDKWIIMSWSLRRMGHCVTFPSASLVSGKPSDPFFSMLCFLNGAFLLFQKAVANEQSLGQIFSMWYLIMNFSPEKLVYRQYIHILECSLYPAPRPEPEVAVTMLTAAHMGQGSPINNTPLSWLLGSRIFLLRGKMVPFGLPFP